MNLDIIRSANGVTNCPNQCANVCQRIVAWTKWPTFWTVWLYLQYYSDVTMGTMASQITSLTIVYWTVYSGADQRKHQSCASLAFVWGIHRWPVNSPHKLPVTRKMFPFDDVIMSSTSRRCHCSLIKCKLVPIPNVAKWHACDRRFYTQNSDKLFIHALGTAISRQIPTVIFKLHDQQKCIWSL